jgi:hypothetical protein
MRIQRFVFAVAVLMAVVLSARQQAPIGAELDLHLSSVLRRKDDVLAANAAGIFWSDLEQKEWRKLPVLEEMPTDGQFGAVPDGSNQIVYYSLGWKKRRQGQKPGIYSSTDSGRTWQLLSEGDDYGPVLLLDSGDLFAVTNARRLNGKASIEVSRDMGRIWRDITGKSFGEIYRLFPDPDHPGLVCVQANSIRDYVFQAEDENYAWKPTRSWDWHPERDEKVPFGRSNSTSSSPLYMLPATLRNYFEHDFGNWTKIPAIDLSVDQERFTFAAGEPIIVPIAIRFLEQTPSSSPPIVEKLIDHSTNLGIWGVRVEFRGERSYSQPGITKAVYELRSADFAARRRDESGFRAAKQKELIDGLRADPLWKTVEFSAAAPYKRLLDIGRLYDFSQVGEYQVQLDHDNSFLGDRKEGHWVGRFSSGVFTVTIRPAN